MKESRARLAMPPSAGTTQGVRAYLAKGLVAKGIMAAVLLLSAGRWDWAAGWALVGLYAAWDVLVALLLIPRSPGLLAERARRPADAKRWDLVITTLAASVLPLVTWVVAGLDVRFGWTGRGVGVPVQVAAMAAVAAGLGLATWAMASNPFFSAFVRIQRERGHRVVADGPYRYVRHPGYLGAIVFQMAIPLALGSLWALLPSGVAAALYVARTVLEDRTLQEELAGYREYAQKVRHRLLPGLW